jgi:hypothetical protein
MKKVLKTILLVLVVLLLLAQFYPRAKDNINGPETSHLSTVHNIPADVQGLFKSSCYDCHSNNTIYPWYYNIQPLAWWLDDHVKEGKREFNFSEFAGYTLAKQYHKLEELEELVTEGEMPLKSYTLAHGDARLTDAQRLSITNWSKSVREDMKARYPADSLIRKKK